MRATLSRAINRPRLAFGCEKSIFFLACVVFLFVLFRAYRISESLTASIVSACLAFSAITQGAADLTKNDPKFIGLRIKAFHPALYDPGKVNRFRAEIVQ